jgi:hypothetical protein
MMRGGSAPGNKKVRTKFAALPVTEGDIRAKYSMAAYMKVFLTHIGQNYFLMNI